MTIPAALFGIVLSTIYGAAFHIWKNGGLRKLILYVILAWLGFWIGHFAGNALGWRFFVIGPINTGMASIGSILFLFVGHWLSRVDVAHK